MDTAGVHHLLQTNQEEAMVCIHPYYLLPELRKQKLVTDLEFCQLSDADKTLEEKNKALLRAIEMKGGEKSFDLFVQALEAEKQHMGHEHLAKVLRDAKAALKSQLIVLPPKLPSKPIKKVCYIASYLSSNPLPSGDIARLFSSLNLHGFMTKRRKQSINTRLHS